MEKQGIEVNNKKLPPITPGEILFEEFLEPINMTMAQLAKAIHVPANRIHQIIKGQREITTDTATRFSLFFGTTPEFWLNLQNHYNLEIFEEKKKLFFKQIKPLHLKKAA